jgi:hypothetical protein
MAASLAAPDRCRAGRRRQRIQLHRHGSLPECGRPARRRGRHNTLVSGDIDGNGVADFQIVVRGSMTLSATNFVL